MSFCTCHLRASHVDLKLLAEFDSGIRVRENVGFDWKAGFQDAGLFCKCCVGLVLLLSLLKEEEWLDLYADYKAERCCNCDLFYNRSGVVIKITEVDCKVIKLCGGCYEQEL